MPFLANCLNPTHSHNLFGHQVGSGFGLGLGFHGYLGFLPSVASEGIRRVYFSGVCHRRTPEDLPEFVNHFMFQSVET